MSPVTRARARPARRAVGVEKKRGRYHHGDLRRALLDAALEVLSREGAAALTLREVARRAGVTHAAPYRHFTDKQALLAAVAEEGFRMLAAEMARAPRAHPGRRGAGAAGHRHGVRPVRHHQARALPGDVRQADIDWSCEHPKLEETADSAFGVLIAQVQACQAAGLIVPGDPLVAALCAWSMVHGLSELIANGQFSALELSVPPLEQLVGIMST